MRDIPIPDILNDYMKVYLSKLFKPGKNDRIFPYTKQYYRKLLRIHAKMAGVKRIRIHDFRHSHASLLVELGASIYLISERLGHKDVKITMNIYAHLYPNKQKEIIDKLNDLNRRSSKKNVENQS
ncbi:MAG: tyrosine-type recombinase/integrase [Bilifractor sp.]